LRQGILIMEFYALDLWNLEIYEILKCKISEREILIAEFRLETLCAGLLEFVAEAYFTAFADFWNFKA